MSDSRARGNEPSGRASGNGTEPSGRGFRDVAVIGLGRVGLPLTLAFADAGLSVIGIDNDPERLGALRDGHMPFEEPGAQEVLDRVGGRLEFADRAAEAHRARHIVLTLGTPAMSHIEIDLRQIRAVLDDLLPHLHDGHAIHLRSTIAPGTTDFVAGYLAKHRGFAVGEEVFVAHVPERIASARFFDEISTLPCIIGGVGARSGAVAAELFAVLGAPIRQTTPVQAELAKIWTNILRYATFALPNLMMMDCEQYGANVFEVVDLINRDYPRGGMALPGFTAGTCLRKDFAFSEERSNSTARRSRSSGWPSRAAPTTSATPCRTSSCGCSSANWPTSPSTTRTSRRRPSR
jgi:UDP-N-acetyl-D-mannosaminuronic acid dehydrogenase